MNSQNPLWGYFIDVVETLVVAAAIFVVVYLFLLQPHQVRGSSMEPNLHNNQYILTDKISYRFGEPSRGDIIVFKAPVDENFDYIKRIIGLPGETIIIVDGKITIMNSEHPEGFNLEEPYQTDGEIHGGDILAEGSEFTISENNYFVMGDNRSQSFDSKDWGELPKENIIGKAWLRYWPISKLSFVKHVNYTN